MQHSNRGFVGAILLILAAAPALAHAQLEKATPPVGGTIASSPPEIRLQFSEGVEPALSRIALAGPSGGAVPLGKPAVDPSNKAVLVAKVARRLPPGIYTVTWRAVSVDTHRTQGSFSFTVGQ